MIESLHTKSPSQSRSGRQLPRIWRSPYSNFGQDLDELQEETVTANAVYTDEVLAGIAASGFTAIWVHGVLHHLVPSPLFAEFGQHSGAHISNMRALIERAAQHGLQIYIYMQPPRGLDERDEFWQAHPEVAGAPMPWLTQQGEQTIHLAMCTSTPDVKTCINDSAALLMRELPELGGLILITASEYPSHCHRYHPVSCPRCVNRNSSDVVGEIIQLVRDGVRSVNSEANIIIWNWSWSFYPGDASTEIVANLPEDVVLMADFERGDTKTILGKTRLIDEYSLSFVGPSKRFMGCYDQALQRGIPTIAKLQLGTTHELATVANLPVIGNLYEKARRLRELGIEGFMGCWNFGNMVTANSVGFNTFFNAERLAPADEALENFATNYFSECDSKRVVSAWRKFASAMDSYPFSIPFIYMGPMNYALAYPLKPQPLGETMAGRSWLNDPRGDRLDECLDDPYSIEEIIQGLGEVASQWKVGAEELSQALDGANNVHAREELDNAWVCSHIWRSTLNTFLVYRLRQEWDDSKLPAFLEIAADELENLEHVLPILERDTRFGYHPEAYVYYFNASLVGQKIADLRRYFAAAK